MSKAALNRTTARGILFGNLAITAFFFGKDVGMDNRFQPLALAWVFEYDVGEPVTVQCPVRAEHARAKGGNDLT